AGVPSDHNVHIGVGPDHEPWGHHDTAPSIFLGADVRDADVLQPVVGGVGLEVDPGLGASGKVSAVRPDDHNVVHDELRDAHHGDPVTPVVVHPPAVPTDPARAA